MKQRDILSVRERLEKAFLEDRLSASQLQHAVRRFSCIAYKKIDSLTPKAIEAAAELAWDYGDKRMSCAFVSNPAYENNLFILDVYSDILAHGAARMTNEGEAVILAGWYNNLLTTMDDGVHAELEVRADVELALLRSGAGDRTEEALRTMRCTYGVARKLFTLEQVHAAHNRYNEIQAERSLNRIRQGDLSFYSEDLHEAVRRGYFTPQKACEAVREGIATRRKEQAEDVVLALLTLGYR